MNYKRKKPKQQVRCTGCTSHRWRGNSTGRFKPQDEAVEPSSSRITPPRPAKKKTFVVLAEANPDRTLAWSWFGTRYADWRPFRAYARESSARQALQVLSRSSDYRDLIFRLGGAA